VCSVIGVNICNGAAAGVAAVMVEVVLLVAVALTFLDDVVDPQGRTRRQRMQGRTIWFWAY